MLASYTQLRSGLADIQRELRAFEIESAESLVVDEKPEFRSAISLAEECGIRLYDWQVRALQATAHDRLILVSRQGGKGDVATFLALEGAINHSGFTVVVAAKADRQAKRLLRRIKRRLLQLSNVPAMISNSAERFELANGSEIIAIPGSEDTTRGIDAVDLLVVDEGAFVPDALFKALYPMLATTDGRCVAMSTANGKRGWFYEAMTNGEADWHRETVTVHRVGWGEKQRFSDTYIDRARRRLGEFFFRQEYLCEFMDDETQLYASALVDAALGETDDLDLPDFMETL